MMKTMEFLIHNPGDSAVSYYLPLKDPSRLIGFSASAGAGQGGGKIEIEDGNSNTIMEADLDAINSAGDVIKGEWEGSATEAQKKVIFDRDNPLVVKINLATNNTVGLQIVVDPFLIGAHEGLS